ncbi:DUF1542 domain-containing protein [Staphylococcus hominis]
MQHVEEKEAAIAKIDQEVTKAKEQIHQALKNRNVDMRKQMVRILLMQSNQKLRKK